MIDSAKGAELVGDMKTLQAESNNDGLSSIADSVGAALNKAASESRRRRRSLSEQPLDGEQHAWRPRRLDEETCESVASYRSRRLTAEVQASTRLRGDALGLMKGSTADQVVEPLSLGAAAGALRTLVAEPTELDAGGMDDATIVLTNVVDLTSDGSLAEGTGESIIDGMSGVLDANDLATGCAVVEVSRPRRIPNPRGCTTGAGAGAGAGVGAGAGADV